MKETDVRHPSGAAASLRPVVTLFDSYESGASYIGSRVARGLVPEEPGEHPSLSRRFLASSICCDENACLVERQAER